MKYITNAWHRIKTPYLYGRALMRHLQGRHEESIKLFNEVLKIDKANSNTYLIHIYIGKSLVILGKTSQGLIHLNSAYDLLKHILDNKEKLIDHDEAISFLNMYKDLVLTTNNTNLIESIENMIREISSKNDVQSAR